MKNLYSKYASLKKFVKVNSHAEPTFKVANNSFMRLLTDLADEYSGAHTSQVQQLTDKTPMSINTLFNMNAKLKDISDGSSRFVAQHGLDRDKFDLSRQQFDHSRASDAIRNQMEQAKIDVERGKLDHMIGSSSFGSGVKDQLSSGVGSMLASPFTAVAKGIENVATTATSAPATTFGYRLNKMMNGGFQGLLDRVEAPDLAAKRFIESASSNMAEAATGLLADMSSKAISGMADMMVDAPARKAILKQLRTEDPIISKMTEQEALDAFHTISKFAPTLAKDKNAVRSALRMAAQSEGGLSYHTIKGLADAELAVSKAKNPGGKY